MRLSTARALSLAVALLLIAMDARAQPACPDSIDVGDGRAAPPSGWERLGADEEGGERLRRTLRRVTFTDGHPRERAFLRPTSSRSEANGDRTDVYSFSPVSTEGIWLVCQYAQTRQSLSRSISATMCEVTENDQPDKAGTRVRSVVCR